MANKFENRKVVDSVDKKKITFERLSATKVFWKFIKPHRFLFVAGLVFLVLSSGTMLIFPYFMGKLVDSALLISSNNQGFSINQVSLILLVVLIFQSIFSFLRIYFFTKISESAVADIRSSLFNKLLKLPMYFYEKNRVGELNSRMSSDVSQIADVLSFTLAEFFRGISVLIVGSIILLFTSTKLTLFMLLTFPIIIISAIIFGKYIRKQSKNTQDLLANSNIIVEESLQNIATIKSFTNENYESERYSFSMQKVVQSALKTAKNRGFFISFVIFTVFGGIVLVMWYGANLVKQGQISVGDLTSFILYTSFIGASVAGLGDIYSQLQKTVGASERIREILEEKTELFDSNKNINHTIKGNISFENVSFSYPSRKDVEVIKNINFNIQSGQKIALVGKSGAGKSTIVQLLMRFHTINQGQILIDNIPISDLDLHILRSKIGIVPQEILLFGGTIRENIAYGNTLASELEIFEAARLAYANEFIEKLPEGMDTLVGERGIKLSGGQRQRIAIARAILKNPPILVLDEATSALDSNSEKMVQSALQNLMKNRTTLIIAHRLSTVQDADAIFVLKDGQISEKGTHNDLISIKESLYLELYNNQDLYTIIT
ncbi:MAG: ATP-binding cassette domain-containing protein [Cytophagales bacterium]|nr:MAG: ATP-binding cassette domain-containing protein [Cytophagales bacterium]